MIGNTRFEMAVHEEILTKNVFNPDVLAAVPTGVVRLPNRFSETPVRRAIEFLHSGKTALDADNALMALAVGAYLEAPSLVTYCFDYVLEWIQGTIGKWIHPSADLYAAAAPQVGDRSSWTVTEKTSADGSASGTVLPAALALGGSPQGLATCRMPTTQSAAAQQKPGDTFERVLEQYQPSAHTTAMPRGEACGSTPGAVAGNAGTTSAAIVAPSEASGQMELLLRIAQGQSSNGGGEHASVSNASIAGLQAMLGNSSKPMTCAPAADTALQMSVSGVSTDTAGIVTGLPAASAAAAAAALSARRASEEGATRVAVRVSGDGGSLPATPVDAVKALALSAAPDASQSGGAGNKAPPRSPNYGASAAERRMHEQRAAEEERMRQMQLANESWELLAALLDSAQTTPEIMNNPQTVELAKHLLMSEQAARAAAGAAGQMASGYAVPPAVAGPPNSCA